jgi:predicted TIM-barrel fold metal-dependent hydrolase
VAAEQQRRIVDCDVHCGVPSLDAIAPYLADHWREHLTILMRYKQPQAIEHTYPRSAQPFHMPAADVTIADLRRDVLEGCSAAIVRCYYGVESLKHPYLAPALATAVNSWLADEWLAQDHRLLGSASITPEFVPAALEEIDRVAADRRFVELLLPAQSVEPYGAQRFWPLWESAARHGLVVGITYGGVTSTPPTPVNWMSSFVEDYAVATLAYQTQLGSLVYSGIFEELPDLRITMSESGWTWLPAFIWRMDTEWKAAKREIPWVKEPPSAYVRRHFRFTTQPVDGPPNGSQLANVIAQLGSEQLLMFGSDHPHVYPRGVEEVLAQMPAEAADRVLWANAWDWYDLGNRLPG